MIRRTLAAIAIIAATLAALVDRPQTIDIASLATQIAAEEDHVTALELAAWLRDRKAGLRIIDLRGEKEFREYHLPRAERVAFASITTTRFAKHETLVLISDGGAHAAQAWVLLRAQGQPHVYFLRGGVAEWLDEVMHPATPTELTRYFGSTPRIDEGFESGDTWSAVAAMRRRGC
ncbi:MAG TPA: rhodanese-like domain-containing protein [Thermoanaerobaculia bacterium]|nr:rhodanese-like domain-containing protein [Thermoanaerobaculia bacterium]